MPLTVIIILWTAQISLGEIWSYNGSRLSFTILFFWRILYFLTWPNFIASPLSVIRNMFKNHNILFPFLYVSLMGLRDQINSGNINEVMWNILNYNKLGEKSPFRHYSASYQLQSGFLYGNNTWYSNYFKWIFLKSD